jgi:hypothetical protein
LVIDVDDDDNAGFLIDLVKHPVAPAPGAPGARQWSDELLPHPLGIHQQIACDEQGNSPCDGLRKILRYASVGRAQNR